MRTASPRSGAALLGAALLAAVLLGPAPPARAQSYDAAVDCAATPTGHIDWPADDPVWSFDFVRPQNSSGTRGSGLELRDVYYRGRLVLRRAHAPILNVEYDPGGCGCYRDWNYEEIGFATDGIRPGTGSCFADATAGVVQTTCDRNLNGGTGGDTGSFEGVAVEDFGDELVLTAHLAAGWYRYRMKWHLYADGRIWPEYSFSAAFATCTKRAHRHHAYWRLDFDLDAAADADVVREVNPAAGTEVVFATEAARTWGNAADGVYWEVRDAATGAGYELLPSSVDRQLPVDPFSRLDFAVTRYHADEMDDGVGTLLDCPIKTDVLVDGEDVADEDVVVWYRSGALHDGGNPWECDIVGPTLVPFGLGTPVEPGPPGAEMASAYELQRAYPNPFNPTTTVRFRVAEAQDVRLALYDALGRRVAVLWEGHAEAAHHETVRVDGTSLPAGTYTVVLEGETVRGSTRVVLVK